MNEAIAICANVATVLVAVSWLYKVVKPVKDFTEDVKEMKEDVKALKDDVKNMKESNKVQCRYMVTIADHMLTGNGVDKIRKTRDELVDHLADL